MESVRIQVRTGPPHPLVCLRGDSGLSDETGKTEALHHSRCGTIKIPPYSKVQCSIYIWPFIRKYFSRAPGI
jgi:hypothetical protein